MATEAGSSALEMYRASRWRRRKRVVVSVLLFGLAAVGALRGLDGRLVLGAAGAGLAVLAVALLSPGGRDIDRWRRGGLAERRTAELLDELPPRRWSVWHDLPVTGSRANIDHVVVGRTGVWLVDTKSTHAVVRAGWRYVRFGDRRLDVGPTKWEAEMLARALAARLPSLPVLVRPVVAVHGRGLGARGVRVGGVPVVPAEHLVPRLKRGRRRLSRADLPSVREAMDAWAGECR